MSNDRPMSSLDHACVMRLAAVASEGVIGDVEGNLRTTSSWLERLGGDRDLILFPEMNVSGYTRDVAVVRRCASRSGEVFDELRDMSSRTDSAFAVGFPEEAGGRLFIAHHLFHDGDLVGTHSKTHLGPTERDVYSEGDRIDVFDVGEMRIGMQLCFETHVPEISYIQARQGANVLAMGFASPREDSSTKLERLKRHLVARAYDNACFLIACNLDSMSDRGTTIPGLGVAIDPKGVVLDEAVPERSTYVSVDCDLAEIERIRASSMGWFNGHKRDDLIRRHYGQS